MDRRTFLATVGAVALAGCSSSDDGAAATATQTPTGTPTSTSTATTTETTTATQTETATATPEPPSFVISDTVGGTYTIGEPWTFEFEVTNTGERGGTFKTTLQGRLPEGKWVTVQELDVFVGAGESKTVSRQGDSFEEPGTVELRLTGTDAVWTITYERPESDFRGPTREDRTYVELQYRDYTQYEVSQIKSSAQDMAYRELFRNAEELRGTPIHYRATIVQSLLADTHDTYLLRIGDSYSNYVYASYVGDRFIQGDVVDVWGEVLGLEIYETGGGSQNTVPALAIADMELIR